MFLREICYHTVRKVIEMKPIFRAVSCVMILMLFLSGCGAAQQPTPQIAEPQEPEHVPAEMPLPEDPAPAVPESPVEPEPIPEPEPEPEPENISIRIVAAGDNLLHNTLSNDSRQSDGTYDFYHLYENIAPIVEGSDIAFINQEVMLTGEVSAYPNLAAPAECADALIQAGFNVVNLATNHSLDKGVKGLTACLENVRQRPFDAILGAFLTQEESEEPCIVEKQGVRFGFLSYTYGLNGYSLPKDKSFMIALIDEGKMKRECEAIRPLCDYLIVSMHWGNEYQLTTTGYQRKLAQELCDWGADLIVGTHPHVLEPVEWLENEQAHKTLCVYSLGNFVSGQHKRATMLGGILDVRLTFDPEGNLLTTDSAGVIPTVTHYKNKGGYTIYTLESYTDELCAEHGVKNYESPLTLDYLNDLTGETLGDFAITWESLQ